MISLSLILGHYLPLECGIKDHYENIKRRNCPIIKGMGPVEKSIELRAGMARLWSVVGGRTFRSQLPPPWGQSLAGTAGEQPCASNPFPFHSLSPSYTHTHTHIPQPRSKSTNNHPPSPKYFLAHRRILTGKINQRGWRRGRHTHMFSKAIMPASDMNLH